MKNASLGRRLGAMLYDTLLVIAVLWLVTLPFIAVRGGEHVDPDDNLVYQLTVFGSIYAFFTFFWSWRGRTLGMQAWRLQLEMADGQSPNIGASSMRFFAAILSLLPAGLGVWWQLWDKDGLSWHDRMSGTRLRHYPKA